MIFAQILRELRISRQIKQAQLAVAVGLNQSRISQWELGKIEPNLDQLIDVANFFEVSTDYLLGRENDEGFICIDSALTPLQYEILTTINKLSINQQHRVLGYAECISAK